MTDTTDDLEPALDLLPNGKVEVYDDGTVYRLRRPKLGELRRLREITEETNGLVRRYLPSERLKSKDPAELAELAETMEKDEVETKLFDLTLAFYREAFGALSDTPLPDDPDDWPAWIPYDRSVQSRLMRHWQTVPLARG